MPAVQGLLPRGLALSWTQNGKRSTDHVSHLVNPLRLSGYPGPPFHDVRPGGLGGMCCRGAAWFGVLGAVGGYDFAGDLGDLDVAALGFLAQALQRVIGVAA
jgi:hypothetical protein